MNEALRGIPSVDRLLASTEFEPLIASHGRARVTLMLRTLLDEIRTRVRSGESPATDPASLAGLTTDRIERESAPSLKPLINLTGTVLHTNLGRAPLPRQALDAVTAIARGGSNLEYDLESGSRGDRDAHIEDLICELTGAEAATVVNNNAAAVLICLNTFAFGKGACISRGELVEIGGSFRIPEVMEKSGARLIEVGATNRTHLRDYEKIDPASLGLYMKVHTSNYEIRGFTQEVPYDSLGELATRNRVPLLADLGSGTLVNLEDHGLEHEPTVQEVLAAGADLVTFSGDKLLGGPQAGIVAGRKELVAQVKKNPLKRALRVDKMTIAALHAVLQLYQRPDSLAQTLPALAQLSRPVEKIRELGESLLPAFSSALASRARVALIDVQSQIGSGALPLDQLPSVAIAMTPLDGSDAALTALSRDFRRLPVPVIGRLNDGRLLFDLRTLAEPDTLINQLPQLAGT